ncbi:MAG: response regulator [Edaphobacter sp.]|uniref:response regulator n=1 Tax=Edaphobacter sp. TaxID=1934404 RepID=UPI0023A3579E|nr:response regulator [Edaphobacter sp.]MDE1178039.1 response regulator [Edaphobacter sp.]
MKRRVLLVDDEVAVLLTLKAVLEINGFDVDTAASAREGRLKLRSHEYHMVITDMRMENDQAGAEVIAAARTATYHPAVALLTAFPMADEDWQELGADHMLVKPMHTRRLLEQIDQLLETHTRKLATLPAAAKAAAPAKAKKAIVAKKAARNAKKTVPIKTAGAKKTAPTKRTAQSKTKKTAVPKKAAVTKKPIKATKPAGAAKKPAKAAARTRGKA